MKTNLFINILPKRVLQNKISKRNAMYAQNVIISENLNPETKSVLNSHKASIGRFLDRKRGSLEFSPVKDGLFKDQTEMTVNKVTKLILLHSNVDVQYTQKPVVKTIIDKTPDVIEKNFLNELKKNIGIYLYGNIDIKVTHFYENI